MLSDTFLEKKQTPRTVDEWLNSVDYAFLSDRYIPTEFALIFVNFVKLVNGEEGEENKTPPVHLKMLEGLTHPNPYVANLCFRGLGKTTLFAEYLLPFLAVMRMIPGFGMVDSALYVTDSMENGAKNLRKNLEFRYNSSEFLQRVLPQAKFTDAYIEFRNQDNQLFAFKLFGAKQGVRGTKIFSKRPCLALLDDLVSDEDARSPTIMNTIKDTVYKGILPALSPTRRKVIFNGTPFNKSDILYEAVESGGWYVNVYPICERFPCTREEFKGAWEDRFDYDFVKETYDFHVKNGKLADFLQEYMLRISSPEDRLVQDSEISWYSRKEIIDKAPLYNFYITTDFSVSGKSTSDYSVISVWAYNYNGDWFLVDGWIGKVTLDISINNLFRLVQMYSPVGTGIEVTGQQQGFISMIQKEMRVRNIYFNLASNGNGRTAGIRPSTDKMSRFLLAVPLFKMGKMYFPSELKETPFLIEMVEEVSLAMKGGFKSKHDDCIDTISMLPLLDAYRPANINSTQSIQGQSMWEDANIDTMESPLDSYLV